jgi:hypothetical protein
MGTLADRIAGRTKQLVAEVIGDGKLAQEGRAQERAGESGVAPVAVPDPADPHAPGARREENE